MDFKKIEHQVTKIAQYKALRHIQDCFHPDGVQNMELLSNGIRLTDCTGAQADFLYINGQIELHEV